MALLVFATVLALRLFHLQVLLRPARMEIIRQEYWEWEGRYRPRRGSILDAHGHLLALDVAHYGLAIDPSSITKDSRRIEIAREIAASISSREEHILQKLRNEAESKYLPLTTGIHAIQHQIAMDLKEKLPELQLEPTFRRLYPEGALAAHVLGFVPLDRKGYYGVESTYCQILTGTVGYEMRYDGPWGTYSLIYEAAQDGADLVLTVDRAVQREAERLLAQAVEEQQAAGGTVIVMEPKTGAILAMANYPSFDPNTFWDFPLERYRNPAISSQYEPGSVFKIITMAAALDSGEVRPDSTYMDNGYIIVGGTRILNSDRAAHQRVTMTELLARSLNVGAATLSTKLGAARFYDYVHRFGFGTQTGIDLDGEISGTVHVPGDPAWSESNLGTNSFGQGIAVTPLQMLTAVAAIANGGMLMRPYVVKEIRRNGESLPIEPKAVRRVVSEKTARELTNMLVEALNTGCPTATIRGYKVAGKTGTAQIPIPGGYDPNPSAIITSFAGYLPADDPRIAILVKIDRPRKGQWAHTVAVPVFRSLAQRLCALLDIPPDDVRLAVQAPSVR